jgi:NADH-quinone oxidoreductase subunit I
MRLYGTNFFTGMALTMRHLFATYREDFKYWFGAKQRQKVFRNKPEDIGSFTVQYPEEKLKVPERFRVLPVLIYEEADGDVRCTSCGICAKVCPPQCIWMVQTKGPDGKPKPKVTEFYIDMDVCMNCGFCSEFCPFDAIKMDHQFELSNYERRQSHVYDLQDLLVSTEYYAKTHPRAWAKELQVKEEEEKKKKAKEAAAAAAAKKKAEEAAKAAAAAAAPGATAEPAKRLKQQSLQRHRNPLNQQNRLKRKRSHHHHDAESGARILFAESVFMVRRNVCHIGTERS